MRKSIVAVVLFLIVGAVACDQIAQPFAVQRFSSRLYLNDMRDRIYSYDFMTKKTLVAVVKWGQTVNDISVSIDGRSLYYDSHYGIRRVSLDEIDKKGMIEHPLPMTFDFSDPASIETPRGLFASYFSVSPDEKYIAFVHAISKNQDMERDWHETDIPDLYKQFQVKARHENSYRSSRLYVLEIKTGRCSRIVDNCDTWKASWFPDSQAILFGAENKIHKYSLSSGKIESIREGSFPSLSPDGSMMAYFFAKRFCWGPVSSEEPEHKLDYVEELGVDGNGRKVDPLSVWSPDGKCILFSNSVGFKYTLMPPFIAEDFSSEIHIFDAETEKRVYKKRLPGHGAYITWARKPD